MYPISKPQIKLKYNLLLDNELNDTSSAFRIIGSYNYVWLCWRREKISDITINTILLFYLIIQSKSTPSNYGFAK